MASSRNTFQIGNLVKYRKHVSHDYMVAIIIGLTKTVVTLYTKHGDCVNVLKDRIVVKVISRPYSKV